MLMPKKVKYRKQMRGRRTGKAWRGGDLAFGEYGLKAMEAAWITDRQIEASRVAITRFIKRGGKLWIRIFPDKPFTKKPAETPMGKGKGATARTRIVDCFAVASSKEGITKNGYRNEKQRPERSRHAPPASDTHRPGHQRQDGEDHRGRSAAPGAAPEIPPRGAHLQKVLRA